jgi:hypothetical protein
MERPRPPRPPPPHRPRPSEAPLDLPAQLPSHHPVRLKKKGPGANDFPGVNPSWQICHILAQCDPQRAAHIYHELPLWGVYTALHCHLLSRGIPCTTPAAYTRALSEADALIDSSLTT